MEKKEYLKPEVVCQRDIEAITGTCENNDNNTMQDKVTANPASNLCLNPLT